MNKSNDVLTRLLRAAAGSAPSPDMPFGLDTRVLALARNDQDEHSIGSLTRKMTLLAALVIALSTVGLYRSSSRSDFWAEYAMADSVIEAQLSE